MTIGKKFKVAFTTISAFTLTIGLINDAVDLNLRESGNLFHGMIIGYLLCLFFVVPTTKE